MAALLAAAFQFGLFKATPAGAEETMEISRDASRPVAHGTMAETFTGEVMVKPLFSPNTSISTGAGQVTFTPCARSAWHTHPAGQTLIVTSGTGWVQQWGGEKLQINPGDVIWTPPGVKHWHGATRRRDDDPHRNSGHRRRPQRRLDGEGQRSAVLRLVGSPDPLQLKHFCSREVREYS